MREEPLLTKDRATDIFAAVVEAILAQSVERVTCNLEVLGSIPGDGSGWLDSLRSPGEIPEWSKGADCKSVGLRLRRFKSFSPHRPFSPRRGFFAAVGGLRTKVNGGRNG